jgi:phosphohistidine swiveling domain-containing protein
MKTIFPFRELSDSERLVAGGKGGTLARLFQAGYPVPDGFVILPEAFLGDELTMEAWKQVETHLVRMHEADEGIAFAVRSSALSEDSAQASFAGEFETVLDVRSDERVKEAVQKVRSSRHSERVKAYSLAKGLDLKHDMAVVVQKLIRADFSGVLFTCDPVTGSHAKMTGNYVHGFGEELVSGEVEPYIFSLTRPKGTYDGPSEIKPFAKKIFKLGKGLERDLASPQDIEWAIKDGNLYLLQSRPITTLIAHDPRTGEWNDSFSGDYLWSRNNFGEGRPDVMTPYTWTLTESFWRDLSLVPGYSYAGNIGGRFYANVSVMVSVLNAIGKDVPSALEEIEGLIGKAPEGMEVPLIPIPKTKLLPIIPKAIRAAMRERKGKKMVPDFLKENPKWCREMEQKLKRAETGADLLTIWHNDIVPYRSQAFWIMAGGTQPYEASMKLKREVTDLVGDEDANTLFSNLSDTSDFLASLGPVVGVAKVANGEMSRKEYLEKFGHRGPHEAELSTPRPIEDPNWLDKQVEEYRRSPVDVEALFAKRREAFENAWQRFEERYPNKAKKIKPRLDKVPGAARMREEVRSEATRMIGIQRAFALRAGEITDLGDDIFFLGIDELLEVLSGSESVLQYIPARRETYEKYCEIPPYPMIIRGRFDPLQWVADPQRRYDIYDATTAIPSPVSNTITGFAGAAGRVEARVRVLHSPEESGQFHAGEILVAASTNVGWTPLFLRAAAVVTDVGAPLSHAAVVARELGIPAVVGCVNATTRLRTGDRVRVDGGKGTVEILEAV